MAGRKSPANCRFWRRRVATTEFRRLCPGPYVGWLFHCSSDPKLEENDHE